MTQNEREQIAASLKACTAIATVNSEAIDGVYLGLHRESATRWTLFVGNTNRALNPVSDSVAVAWGRAFGVDDPQPVKAPGAPRWYSVESGRIERSPPEYHGWQIEWDEEAGGAMPEQLELF